jgi:pyridoxal phosphate enzyme (YggS family)
MGEIRVRDHVAAVFDQVERSAAKAGRPANEITLVAVSKTQSAEAIREAFAAGVRHFGENRVQEWEGKHGNVADLAGYWHLVGHLQSNKAARSTRLFHSIDSVDDLALARKLDRARAEELEHAPGTLRVLIEVRLSSEERKNGVDQEHLPALAEGILQLPRLQLAGLLCIPPFFEDKEEVRPYFARLRESKTKLESKLGCKLPVLSMGMSHDFAVAIEEGATEVRVGTALFGARETR